MELKAVRLILVSCCINNSEKVFDNNVRGNVHAFDLCHSGDIINQIIQRSNKFDICTRGYQQVRNHPDVKEPERLI